VLRHRGEDEKGYISAILEKIATRVPAPILIDSTEADVVEEALKRIPAKPLSLDQPRRRRKAHQ